MSGHPASEGSADPIATLLRGAAAPALAGLVVLTGVAAFSGRDAVLSSLTGGGMALVALVTGPLLHRLCRSIDPAMTVGVVVLVYGTMVVALGVAYSALADTRWLAGTFAGGGVLVVAVGWAVGQMRAAARLRQPLWSDEVGR